MPQPNTYVPIDDPLTSELAQFGKPADGWRRQLHEIVFESDSRAGKIFDVILCSQVRGPG